MLNSLKHLKNQNSKKKASFWRYRYLYLMLIPAGISYLLFHYMPMYGLVIAFKDYDVFAGINQSPFVGLKYFREVFGDQYFWEATRNTVLISIYRLVFEFPCPIIVALLLNEIINIRFKKIVQTIIYLPHFISWVIIASILMQFLSATHGIVNDVLLWFGGEKINFLIEKDYFRSIIVISSIWKNAGWGSIIYIAALAGVDPGLYEAAIVDGANKWRQVWHITLPSIRPTIVVMFILQISKLLNIGFDQVFVLLNPMVREVGEIIDTYVYRTGLQFARFSYATVVGLFKSAIGLVLILASDRSAKRLFGDGIF